ncbi:BET1-like protein isoform X1 [Hydra vulgaris]|uniref:BET1-like protein n=1 Tax=Hydra vulgaris TaxID=6087 RepID=T2M487_HYDVU|nr:BET1-like protein [Hydra vulgaris]
MTSWKPRGTSSYHKLPNDENILHDENDRMVSNLSTKISTLKNIAIEIDKEAKYQNEFVGGMAEDFDSAGGFLGSTMKRLNTLVSSSSSNRKLMCYLIIILVGTFFVLYFITGILRK